jgi:hypothetical protein
MQPGNQVDRLMGICRHREMVRIPRLGLIWEKITFHLSAALSDGFTMIYDDSSHHYLAGHYTTHQPDGVHIEARCTCGVKFEGVGQDGSATMDALWTKFLKHRKDNP